MDSARAAVRSVASDGRSASEIGRHARLELTFGCRGDRTVLLHSYAEPPLRVGRVLPDGQGVHLILASSAPGVFGGDYLKQTITVEAGARVRLASQSAMQAHPHDSGARATLEASYRVERGGHLECAWDPLIPFAGVDFDQRIRIDLSEAATLVWSDALMAGREASGERWRFARLAHDLRVVRNGALVYTERYRIAPGTDRPEHAWVANRACYFGTLLASGAGMTGEVASDLHHRLQGRSGLRASADLLEEQLVLVRLVGDRGPAFHEARALANDVVRRNG